jgi:uncharacterized protein YecE (DUF72 family)
MTNFLIGTGGWAYFTAGLDPLAFYSTRYNFVEVNSTFYTLPSRKRVLSWRQRVPKDFTFAVRCPQAITHQHHFNLTNDALIYFHKICNIYQVLAARYLVFVTPPQFPFTHQTIDNIKSCFQRLKEQDIQAVWEIRTPLPNLPRSVTGLMRDYKIIHGVDLSQYLPLYSSPIIYTRLFGHGQHNVYQFTNQELTELDHTITKQHVDEAVISFHNVKMYKDAARYHIYKETHHFPPVTTAEDQNSLRQVLLEDAQFPITTQDLIADQGWKVIDLSNHTTCHARDLLSLLPNKYFQTLEDVLSALKQISDE